MISWVFNRLLRGFTKPIPPGLWVVNVLFQRLLGFNSSYDWQIHFTSSVTGSVTIGENVWVSFAASGGCYVQGINGVEIGDNTIFAPGVKIISANHIQSDLTCWQTTAPIKIGKSCWLGANSVILPGVQLGDRVIVGAGAVVTKNFSSDSVVAGVPAKSITA